MRFFTFGTMDSRNYNTLVFESKTFGTPTRNITAVEVPGRNGSLLIDNGNYLNIDHAFDCIIPSEFKTNMANLRSALLSQAAYARLEDSEHPDEFYLAVFKDAIEDVAVTQNIDMGRFQIIFNRKPQRFLKSGETITDLQSNGSITNPTMFRAKPLLRVYGTGSFSVGSSTMVISSASTYTDIDCDLMEAYKGTTSCNANISGNFPTLAPGTNGVTLGSGITRIMITPRWWRL